jgi:hypothetical protein
LGNFEIGKLKAPEIADFRSTNMKIHLIVLIAFAVLSCSPKPSQITLAEVKNFYGDLFGLHVEKRERGISFYFEEKKLSKNHPCYKIYKDYELYCDYLMFNYCNVNVLQIATSNYDSLQSDKKFVELLKTDSLFNSQFLPLVYNCLKSKKITITDYAPPAKQRIKESDLVTAASRFFYAANLDTVKRVIDWYICVGKNPYYNNPEIKKLPAVEAFSFLVLMDHKYYKSDFKKDFHNNIKLVAQEARQVNGWENKLALARKRMPEEMVKSEDLKRVLLKEYHKQKNILPFMVE